jgi:hypothetical protein
MTDKVIYTNLCPACFEEQYGSGNPCQCLSCDPDGTRYICTCPAWVMEIPDSDEDDVDTSETTSKENQS